MRIVVFLGELRLAGTLAPPPPGLNKMIFMLKKTFLLLLLGWGILAADCKAQPAGTNSVSPNAPGETWTAQSQIAALQAASEQGDATAQAFLGYMLVHGVRVAPDVPQGLELLHRSADQGFSHAMAELGSLYLRGGPVTRNYDEALRWLKRGADLGEPGAERDLGVCFQLGHGVETNLPTAASWYLRAAEQTNYIAMKDLAVMYANGTGVTQDYPTAIHWFTLAAEGGQNARAMYNLGMLAETGKWGVADAQATAIQWYRRSAALGDPKSCWRLAVCYRYGKGVPPDMTKYLRFMRQAATGGEAEAQYFLGTAYRLGQGMAPSQELEMAWYQAAATNNYPEAYHDLAMAYAQDKTNESAQAESQRCLLQAARLGHREAQFRCAMMAWNGPNGRKDLPQFRMWLERSAEGGWPKSEYVLSQALGAGWPGFETNAAASQKWLERAAAHGDFDAQCMLAIRLIQGELVKKDSAQALRWWRWAAERGWGTAQNDLGYAIETGEAGQADLVEACMWFQLAAKNGIARADINLSNLSARLTPAELAEASRRTAAFQVKPVPELRPVVRDGESGTPQLDMSRD